MMTYNSGTHRMKQLSEVNKFILPRRVPKIQNAKIRWATGLLLLMITFLLMFSISQASTPWLNMIWIFFTAWVVSVCLTDKYTHKYPQRYKSYLFFSHLKAFFIMAFLIILLKYIVGLHNVSLLELATGTLIFSLLDVTVSYPNKNQEIDREDARKILQVMGGTKKEVINADRVNKITIYPDILKEINKYSVDRELVGFFQNHLPLEIDGSRNIQIVDDLTSESENMVAAHSLDMLFCTTSMNDVKRLNLFLEQVVNRLAMGGYFVMKYMPLENVYSSMRKKHSLFIYRFAYFFHFLWFRAFRKIPFLDKAYFSRVLKWLDKTHLSIVKKRNRALSKAEMWGRLAFWGMDVVAESQGDKEKFIIARRINDPHPNRLPSYYPVVALAKVGLDGKVLRMHKLRSMYAFSEYIQNRIFKDQGLTETGKFKNDFRLTEYGKFIRRYWLDELPQLYDWLKGDIKLVGMRATSAHYMSLYPQAVYDLYIQVKPGLISPIFDEKTSDFSEIVKVEHDYLLQYIKNPVKADMKCFFQTFTDIFFRGVRSK
jgi:lipopolysaccharide/colanic/teichoic acid biosynthesis glycosyltransferase